jgi:hypothetical protein
VELVSYVFVLHCPMRVALHCLMRLVQPRTPLPFLQSVGFPFRQSVPLSEVSRGELLLVESTSTVESAWTLHN